MPKSYPRCAATGRGASPGRISLKKLARDAVSERAVVFAESQTKGRGRLGRKWLSPARKGLWFSVLLRPALRPQDATQLTVVSATALRRAIQNQTGLKTETKWPN